MRKMLRKTALVFSALTLSLSAFSPFSAVYAEEVPAEETEAAENPSVEEADYLTAVKESGLFYLESFSNEINEGSSAVFKVARGGENLKEAHVRLSLIDISARYGEDYDIRVLGQDVTPEVPEEMTSILEEVESGSEMIEEVSDAETDYSGAELTEEDSQALSELIGEELSRYASLHPDEFTIPAEESGSEEEQGTSALSRAFSRMTGLEDDGLPMSSDGSAVLDINELMAGYTVDTVEELSSAFSSAYVQLDFEEGQKECVIEIRSIENEEAKGGLLAMAAIFAADTDTLISEMNTCTFSFKDNEKYAAPSVSFSDELYYAEDGYVSVTLERSGIVSGFSSVRLYTEDDTAQSGRDYSGVDAKVSFPFGVEKRTVKIPVRSKYLSDTSGFHLYMDDAENCAVNVSQSYGVISKDSGNYEPETITDASEAKNSILDIPDTVAGNNVSLDITGGLSSTYNNASASWNGSYAELKANGWVWDDSWCRYNVNWHEEERRKYGSLYLYPSKAFQAIRVNWEKSGGGSSTNSFTFSADNQYIFEVNEDSYSRRWDSYKIPFDSGYLKAFWFYNEHNGSPFESASNLKIHSVELVPRLMVINANVYNSDDLKFVNEKGELVNYSEANLPGVGSFKVAAGTHLNGAYIGDTVTVSTDDTYSYIKALYIGDTRITPEYPAGTSSVSFKLDNDFYKKYSSQIESLSILGNSYGRIYLGVELGQYQIPVTLHNDDQRGKLEFGFEANKKIIHKGDYVALRQSVNSAYRSSYTQSRIQLKYRSRADEKDTSAFFLFDEGSDDTYTFRQVYSKIDAWPCFDAKVNRLTVRVKDEDINQFDQSYGIFTSPSEVKTAGYHDYIVVGPNEVQAGKRYELKVKPKDEKTVGIWQAAFKESRYSQNTWWFEADSDPDNNVITLTAAEADEIPYSLSGRAFYTNYSMVTGSEGEAWMAADGILVRQSEQSFGFSDEKGEFRVIPAYGLAGCKVQYQIHAMGRTEYRIATLRQDQQIKMGDLTVYDINTGALTVSPLNKDVPYPVSVSLDTDTSTNTLTAMLGSPGSGGLRNKFTVIIANDNHDYTDLEGNPAVEKVTRVQLFAYDPLTNVLRGQIAGDLKKISDDGESVSVWELESHLEEGSGLYEPSDRIYVRVTTDRKKAKAYDADGNEVSSDAYNETAWPDLYTGMTCTSVSGTADAEYDMDFMDTDLNRYFELPFFNMLNFTMLVKGVSMSFQELPGNVCRFSIGKILNEYNNINDTKENFNGFADAVTKASQFGQKVKGEGSILPVKNGGFNPFLGLYIDFAPGTVNADGDKVLDFQLIGGGLYVGARLWGKINFYLPVCCVPLYVGINGGITAYANLGMHDTKGIAMHSIKDGTADLDNLWDPDFMIKAEGDFSLYGGVGMAGTIGLRGGVLFYAQYIYNPTITDIYPDFDIHGGKFTANFRLWADLLFFTVIFPIKTFANEPYGYIEMMQNMQNDSSSAKGNVIYREATEPEWKGDAKMLMSAPKAVKETILQSGGYDRADAKLLDMGENGTLLVYLSADASRPAGDQSVLQYSIYKDGSWSDPVRIGDERTLSTADYMPDLCDAGDSVMISWVSRENASYENNLEYLGLMDVYTCLFDKQTHEITEIECMSEGDYQDVGYYNCRPVGVYDEISKDRMIYYQKSAAEEKAVDEALFESLNEDETQLLANVSPSQNGSYIVYMLHDHTTGSWARDHIYENEVSNEASRNYLIESWGGQRFLGSPIREEDWNVSRPVIIDFDAISYNGAALYAFTVDKDNRLDTDYDRDLFVQVYDFETHRTYHPVRITDDSYSDAMPHLIRTSYTDTDGSENAHTWLFWLEGVNTLAKTEDGSSEQVSGYAQIQYLDVADLISYGIYDDGTIGNNGYSIHDETHVFSYAGMNPLEIPSFAGFNAYVDNEDNLYLAWSETAKDTEAQEIYVSALIDRRNGSAWSIPVQVTESGLMHDEIAMSVNESGELILVSNRWSFDPQSSTAGVRDYSLGAVICQDAGSLEAVAAGYSSLKPMPGETVTAELNIQNRGLKAAEGYAVKVYEVRNGVRSSRPVYSRGDGSTMSLLSLFRVHAEETVQEEKRILPGETVTESFEYTIPADMKEGETISLYAEVTENNVKLDAMKASEVGEIRFEPQYEMTNVSVIQTPDGFRLTAEVRNTGNIASSDGDVTFKAEFCDLYQEGLEGTWAEVPVAGLQPEESIFIDEILNIDDRFLTHGFANGFADLTDRNGEDLLVGTDFIAALEYPYHITVNDDPDMEEIQLKPGEALDLTAVYGPADFYQNGTVEFTPLNGELAHMEGNRLVGDEAGETWLRVYVSPFGGEKLIRLIIVSAEKTDDPKPSAKPDEIKPAGTNPSADTSDSNRIPLYTGILGISLLTIIAVILYRRKHSQS